jgi:hypothetical protein
MARRIFKVNPKFYSHPKVVKAGNEAIGVWTVAGSWVASEDSYLVPSVPESMLRLWARRPSKPAAKLVELGFWEPTWIRLFDDVWEQAWDFVPDDSLFRLQVVLTRPAIDPVLRARVYARDGYACLHCGRTENLSLDHIHPFSKGGQDTYENLQTLCVPCNSSKGARI